MDLSGTFSGVGSMKPEEVWRQRAKDGQCLMCGCQCYKISKIFKKRTPLTIEDKVLNGKCLICDPDHKFIPNESSRHNASVASIDVETMVIERSGKSLNSFMPMPVTSKVPVDHKESTPENAITSESTSVQLTPATSALAVNGQKPQDEEFVATGAEIASSRKSVQPMRASKFRNSFSMSKARRNSIQICHSNQAKEAITLVGAINDIEDLTSMMFEAFADMILQRAVIKQIKKKISEGAVHEVMEQIYRSNISILVLDSIEMHMKFPDTTLDLWEFLNNITKESVSIQNQLLENNLLHTMSKTLVSWAENQNIMITMLKTLFNCHGSFDQSDSSIQQENAVFLSEVLHSQSASAQSKRLVINIMICLCKPTSPFYSLFAASKGLGGFIEYMFATEELLDNQIECCNFIEKYGENEKVTYELIGEGVILQISQAMNAHLDNADLQASACKALKAVIYQGHVEIMNFGIADLVLRILNKHPSSSSALKESFLLLAILVKLDESYGAMLHGLCTYDLKTNIESLCHDHSELLSIGAKITEHL